MIKKIYVFDALGSKKLFAIPVEEKTLIEEICEKIDPEFRKQDKTLYFNDLELLWNWSVGYVEKNHPLPSKVRLSLLVRIYDLQQTCKVLQLDEEEVKTLVQRKKIKVFSKKGKLMFKRKDVDDLRDTMMECPTIMIPNSSDFQEKLNKAAAEVQAEKEEFKLSTTRLAQRNQLKIYDSTSGISKILLLDSEKSVRAYCLEVNPQAEEEGMTLFQEEKELDPQQLLGDLIRENQVDFSQKFVLKIRFYSKEKVLEKLKISEKELKKRVHQKELRVFSKRGKWIFRKKDIDELAFSS
jgi:hypothetical protein